MKDQFVPYELAVKLKELGVDGECLAYYNNGELWVSNKRSYKSFKLNSYLPDKNSSINNTPNIVYAPLWQQAFDWFGDKHNLFPEFKIDVVFTANSLYSYRIVTMGLKADEQPLHYYKFSTIEEARQACLEKLIEICQNLKKEIQ